MNDLMFMLSVRPCTSYLELRVLEVCDVLSHQLSLSLDNV